MRKGKMRMGLRLIILCLIILINFLYKTKADTVTRTCKGKCGNSPCEYGCNLWRQAVLGTCLDICNEAENLNNEVSECLRGCNLGVEIYSQRVKDKLKAMTCPVLVAGGKRNVSVLLRWKAPDVENITFLVQKKYVHLTGGWQNNPAVQWLPRNQVRIQDLHPYVSYKFRVVAVVTSRDTVVSPESVPIATLPYGVPAGTPNITSLSTSASSVHLKWEPPHFINAQLLGYKMTITPASGSGYLRVKELLTYNMEAMSYVFTLLNADTQYIVSVAVINQFGLGRAVEKLVRTKPWSQAKGNPYLILGANKTLLKQDLHPSMIFREPQKLYTSNSHDGLILGVGIHYRKQLVFFSDSNGLVQVINMTDNQSLRRTKRIYSSQGNPRALSVDWLHDKLYIAEDTQILQCELNGTGCRVAIDHLIPRAVDIKIDPCNGYLFWAQDYHGLGLFRIDLADVGRGSNITTLLHVVKLDLLSAFTIDHLNYRIFFPNNSWNTLMSAYLDGTDLVDTRQNNTQRKDFLLVTDIVQYDGLFCWTNGSIVLMEERHKNLKIYYQNQMPFLEYRHFAGLAIWHPSAQPIPAPLLAPQNLQALFSTNSATLSWLPPQFDLGAGAWQDWQYEVEVGQVNNRSSQTFNNMKVNHLIVQSLVPGTFYWFRIRAYSEGGFGLWSEKFTGQTIKKDATAPYIMYADDSAIYRTTVDGNNATILWAINQKGNPVQDMVRVGDLSVWSLHNGSVFKKVGNRSPVLLGHIDNVAALAYDWLARMLYWSSTRHNMIQRSPLSENKAIDPETIHQANGSVQDIELDSAMGRVYWTTSDSIESAHLNGHHHHVIQKLPYLSGKYIMGLALDMDTNSVFWLLKDGDKVTVYKRGLLERNDNLQTQTVDSVISSTRSLSLDYYSGKLFWQGGGDVLCVMDTVGRSLAHMMLQTSSGQRVGAFTAVHPSKILYPKGVTTSSPRPVIPRSVNASSLKITGRADRFNITWTPSVVSHGKIYYELTVDYDGIPQKQQTDEPFLLMTGLSPYRRLTLTLKSCTRWRCSKPIQKTFRTPMAAPSEPSRPRVFVTHHKDITSSHVTIDVEFRWSRPARPNGEISRYVVMLALRPSGPWSTRTVERRRCRIMGARRNSDYYFKVKACTRVGCSPFTTAIVANTTVERPVPRILTSAGSALELYYPDDKNSQKYNATFEGIISVTYIAQDHTLFFLDSNNCILKLESQGNKPPMQILSLSGLGVSLAVDWIARDLFWLERKNSAANNIIMKYDLSRTTGHYYPVKVLTRTALVQQIATNPYQSTLYWTEVTTMGWYRMMRCDMGGINIRPLFEHPNHSTGWGTRRKRDACNCPALTLSPLFVLDHSNTVQMEIYVINNQTGDIWASDTAGCSCRLVVNASNSDELGLPPDSLTVDQERLYWSNERQRTVNSVNKYTGLEWAEEATGDVKNIVAYGEHLQPMPDVSCLLAVNYSESPVLVQATNTSLTVNISPWKPNAKCIGISTPSQKYTVHYRKLETLNDLHDCTEQGVICKTLTTYDLITNLEDLSPFSKYLVQVSVSNFYTELQGQSRTSFGPPAIFNTSKGVPSAARNVTAEAFTPTVVNVQWLAPEFPNGDLTDIIFEIKWYTWNTDGTKSQGIVKVRPRYPISKFEGRGEVGKLKPDQVYFFKVLAYDRKKTGYSESTEVSATTFQYPGPIQLLDASKRTVTVVWTSPSDDSINRHSIEYTQVMDNPDWTPVRGLTHHTKNSTEYNVTVRNLLPNTKYAFRVNVVYKPLQHFIWPNNMQNTVQTAADVPDQPDAPILREPTGGVAMVMWDKPDDRGSPIEQYRLIAGHDGNWSLVYNGSEPQWIIAGGDIAIEEIYVFQVAAKNAIGWGRFSENSTVYTYSSRIADDPKVDQLTLVLASSFVALFIMIVIALIILFVACRRYKDHKHIPFNLVGGGVGRQSPDTELATLRELPRVARQASNALYAINIIPTDEDVAALPHFRRDRLVLTKFLGSGAFGEVFEGVAKNIITETSGETRVAVKTLRKGATDQEKEEFLKEALLMSNFKHEHILRLLGVCLDNDPQFIILELMESGDLLSYLRYSRPTPTSSSRITLPDMVCICCDVARGCKYLEEMHFVHRDLAARNCLVSCTNEGTVVKIGDFGLARDIYKNDYYRKEGEGLLPVRWMSPESLIDGVFTTQSDVWAFGVLQWEVLTLGQQPYPARTNIEVLHFVRNGGRLDRPDNCPDDLYQLMLHCWTYGPDDRPSFNFVLEQLETFKRMSTDPNSQFFGNTPMGGLSNMAYEELAHDLIGNDVVDSASDDGIVLYAEVAGLQSKPSTSLAEGGADDSDSSGSANPRSHNSQRLNPRRNGPFDVINAHHLRRDNGEQASGYLEPLVQPDDRHKYLELLEDSQGDVSPGSRGSPGEKKSRFVPPFSAAAGKKLNYAQLATSDDSGVGNLNAEPKSAKDANGNRNTTPPPGRRNRKLSSKNGDREPACSDAHHDSHGAPDNVWQLQKAPADHNRNSINYTEIDSAPSKPVPDSDHNFLHRKNSATSRPLVLSPSYPGSLSVPLRESRDYSSSSGNSANSDYLQPVRHPRVGGQNRREFTSGGGGDANSTFKNSIDSNGQRRNNPSRTGSNWLGPGTNLHSNQPASSSDSSI